MSTLLKDLKDRTDVELVKGIQFSLFSHEDIRKGSVCDVLSVDTYDGNVPKNNGLFDHNMGTIDPLILCPVDMRSSQTCPGYFGKIDLALPVFNIYYVSYVEKLLKCVCFRCGNLLLDKSDPAIRKELEGKKGYNRFVSACKLAMKSGKNGKKCMYNGGCMVAQPTKYTRVNVANNKDRDNVIKIKAIFAQSAFKDAAALKEYTFTPSLCYVILKKIKDEDVEFMGFNAKYSRPEWMIVTSLPVPPPSMRPSIRQSDNQRSEDDLTYCLATIIKANKGLKQAKDGGKKLSDINAYQGWLQYEIATYMNNDIPGVPPNGQRSSLRPLKAIAQRLKGKEGRMRGNIMGKRVDYSARSVISVDPNIMIDEFGVPQKIAMILTFPEIVTPYNIVKLQKTVRNGAKNYPGAKSVTKMSGPNPIDYALVRVDVQKVASELEYGDIVHRHLVDGDICLFNRQPTLHRMSMMGHRIKVLPFSTFRLNITVCDPYNADFDGDEMNMHAPRSLQTLEELRQLTLVPTQMISPGKSTPVLSLTQDTLLGGYLMTQENIILFKNTVHNLLCFNDKYTGYLPEPTGVMYGQPYWTGKQLFSMILPDISLEKGPAKIVRGKLEKGFLDKKTLGDSSGSLVHHIHNAYGVEESTNFLNHSQALITRWITQHGFTISYKDCIMPGEVHVHVKEIIDKYIKEAHELIHKAHQGLYMPDLDEIYRANKLEADIVKTINEASKEIKKLVMSDIKDNAFFKEVFSGAQGKEENFQQIIGCLGQSDYQGTRIPYGFTGRTSPHFHRYDISPDSRGFGRSGFAKGLSPTEIFFHAMASRLSNISKSITTADSGYTSRKYIKATEDLKVNYDFTVRNAFGMILQFSYGDDNFDPTKIERVSINLFEYDDDQMKKMYAYDEETPWETFMTKGAIEEMMENPRYKEILKAEYQSMLDDRDALRHTYFHEVKNIGDVSCFSPLNLKSVIHSNLHKFNIQTFQLSDISPLYVIEKYNAMVESILKYMPEKKMNIVTQQILFHSFLSSKRVIKEYRMNKLMFDYMIEMIRHRVIDSFIQPGEMVGVIAAQTLGESSTQLAMNAFHTAGTASGAQITQGLPRLREIITITQNLKQKNMHIYLTDENSTSKESARKVMSKITYTKLKDLIQYSEIIFNGAHTKMDKDEDREFMQSYHDFATLFGIAEKNQDCFSPWTLRIVFSKEAMMARKMTVQEIQETIKESSHSEEDIQCLYSDNNANDIVMRIRVKSDGKHDSFSVMKDLEKLLIELKIRGIQNIMDIDPIEGNLVSYNTDGCAVAKKEWLLQTNGSNLLDVLAQDGVDATRTITNDIVEFYEVFGIEAARSLLYHEFMVVYNGKTVPRHVKIMADVMTYRGKLTQIDRHGLNRNSDTGPIGKACFEEVMNVFTKAALFAERDNMKGVSANIMCGQFCQAGTNTFDILMDEEKMMEIESNGFGFAEPDFTMTSVEFDTVDAEMEKVYGGPSKLGDDVHEDDFEFGLDMGSGQEHKLGKMVPKVSVVANRGEKVEVLPMEMEEEDYSKKPEDEAVFGEIEMEEEDYDEEAPKKSTSKSKSKSVSKEPAPEKSKSKSKSKSASKEPEPRLISEGVVVAKPIVLEDDAPMKKRTAKRVTIKKKE